MKTLILDKEISYDGTQLQSHWILKNSGLKGDAILAFIGPANVALGHMADLEDVLADKPIYSERMLHFLVEHFNPDLEKMILRQRLLICILQEELQQAMPTLQIIRKGDDLYFEHFKLTVSIATTSAVSTLIHTGINISSRNTPLPTKGLDDFKIAPCQFAQAILNRYQQEMEEMEWARCKVRAVQ